MMQVDTFMLLNNSYCISMNKFEFMDSRDYKPSIWHEHSQFHIDVVAYETMNNEGFPDEE